MGIENLGLGPAKALRMECLKLAANHYDKDFSADDVVSAANKFELYIKGDD